MFTGKQVPKSKHGLIPFSESIKQLQFALWSMLNSILIMIQAFSEREKKSISEESVKRFEYQIKQVIHTILKIQTLIYKKKLVTHFDPDLLMGKELTVDQLGSTVESIMNLIHAREFKDSTYKEEILTDLYSFIGDHAKIVKRDVETMSELEEPNRSQSRKNWIAPNTPWLAKGIFNPKGK